MCMQAHASTVLACLTSRGHKEAGGLLFCRLQRRAAIQEGQGTRRRRACNATTARQLALKTRAATSDVNSGGGSGSSRRDAKAGGGASS